MGAERQTRRWWHGDEQKEDQGLARAVKAISAHSLKPPHPRKQDRGEEKGQLQGRKDRREQCVRSTRQEARRDLGSIPGPAPDMLCNLGKGPSPL